VDWAGSWAVLGLWWWLAFDGSVEPMMLGLSSAYMGWDGMGVSAYMECPPYVIGS
jgi:hypothetical protein